MATETLHIGFGIKTETDGLAVETADDASLAEGQLLAELLPYTNPTFAIGEQLSLVLALETASGDLSPFTLNVREPTGARRLLTREAPLVLTGGETIPMLELRMRGNAAAGDQSVTVSVAQVRGTKSLISRFGGFSSEERTILIPGTCPHEPGGKMVSEEKIAVIEKISGQLCIMAHDNNLYGILKTLEGMGNHYLGEPITFLEAYPYIRCPGLSARNHDLLRAATLTVTGLDFFMRDVVVYLADEDENACGPNFYRKIVMCKRDTGYGCTNLLELMDNKRRHHEENNSPHGAAKFAEFIRYLNKKLDRVGGPVRDARFCREVFNEPTHCSAGG